MSVFSRLEAACATFVETTFARVFPSDLQPAQVGAKLAVVMQATPSDTYLVRVHPSDYVRFERDRDYLESRWSSALAEAAKGTGPPRVILHEDAAVVAGSVTIEAVVDEARPRGALGLTVEGEEPRRRFRIEDGLTIGRTNVNAVVIVDPRVSREHARIVRNGDGFAIEDRDSSNGTTLNGAPVRRAPIAEGDTIVVGATTMRVETLDA